MEIFGNVGIRILKNIIRNNSLDDILFIKFDALNVVDESGIFDFFRVDTPGIFFAEEIG